MMKNCPSFNQHFLQDQETLWCFDSIILVLNQPMVKLDDVEQTICLELERVVETETVVEPLETLPTRTKTQPGSC